MPEYVPESQASRSPAELFREAINYVTTYESGYQLAFNILAGQFKDVGRPTSELLAELGTRLTNNIPSSGMSNGIDRYTEHFKLLTTILSASAQLRQAEFTKQG